MRWIDRIGDEAWERFETIATVVAVAAGIIVIAIVVGLTKYYGA